MNVLYGAEWCPGCKTLKKQLENSNISFTYKDVDEVEVGREAANIGIRGIPFATINNEHYPDPNINHFLGSEE